MPNANPQPNQDPQKTKNFIDLNAFDWMKRMQIALDSDKYHYLLKKDERYEVRRAVVGMNPDLHEEMIGDIHPKVRLEIAEQSPHLHHLLENDEDEAVLEVIKKHREKEKLSRVSLAEDELTPVAIKR